MKVESAHVVVIGAGLTGAATALELAQRGIDVVLVERDARPMNRASLRNEGKIHLGLIYANDPTLETARLQLRGALRFRALLRRWLGPNADTIRCSTPFHYFVALDSLLSPQELAAHYDRLQACYEQECAADSALDYFGARPDRLARPLPRADWSPRMKYGGVQAVFETAELAIDPADLSSGMARALSAHPRVSLRTGHRVERVCERDGGIEVSGWSEQGEWRFRAAQVVNAAWENRLYFDEQMGVPVHPGWVHRLKYRAIVKLPVALRGAPSMTMVIGRYGDVVVRPDGTAYLSWYPAGLRGWSHAIRPPDAWDPPARGEAEPALCAEIFTSAVARLETWYPGLSDSEPVVVDAGAIVAYGLTDVDRRDSGLHDRTRIGVASRRGYHSVDPGKLTTAPLFALEAADRVAASLNV